MQQPFEIQRMEQSEGHLGIASALTQALFPPRSSQAYQSVTGVRKALDEVQTQIKRDFLHKQTPRPASRQSLAVIIPESKPSSPRSRPISPSVEPRQNQVEPHFDPVFNNTFLDYYQNRKANGGGSSRLQQGLTHVAASLDLLRAKRSVAAMTGLATHRRDTSPSGLKRVLSQLQTIRPPIVVLHNRCASAEGPPSLARSHTASPRFLPWGARGNHTHSSPLIHPARSAEWAPAWSSRPASRAEDMCKHNNIRLHGHKTQQDKCSNRENIQLLGSSTVQTIRPWSGCQSPEQQGSPQNHLVLRTLALHTPHNIVAPDSLQCSSVTATAGCASYSDRRSSSMTCSYPVTAQPYRMYTSPNWLLSPQNLNCVSCSGCSQQHSLQHHRSCCHCCIDCCQCHTSARCAPQPAAEDSNASSNACSCPCIKAYKKGQRDAEKGNQSTAAEAHTRNTAVTPTAAPAANAVVQAPAILLAAEEAQREVLEDNHAGDYRVNTELFGVGQVPAAPEAVTEADAMHDPGDADFGEDHLVGLLQQMNEMQEELLQQGPPFDAQVLEEISNQLAQMVAWSEPQHEELLRQALAKQQELLTIQQRELLASNPGANTNSLVLHLPQQSQQDQQHYALQQPRQQVGTTSGIGIDRTGVWVADQHQRALQDDPLSARIVQELQAPEDFSQSSPNSTLAAVSRLLSMPDDPASLVVTGSPKEQQSSGAVCAALHDGGKSAPVANMNSRTGKDLSMRSPRQQGNVSWMDNPLAQDHEQLLGLLDLHGDESKLQAADPTGDAAAASGFMHHRSHQQQSFTPRGANHQQHKAFPAVLTKEDSEAILAAVQAAYDDAFAHGAAQPMVRFMMAPNYATDGGDNWANRGAVLCQGPPQVTAIAQVVDQHTGHEAESHGRSLTGFQAASSKDAFLPAHPCDIAMASSVLVPVDSRDLGKASQRSAEGQQQRFSRPVASAAGVAGLHLLQQPASEELMGCTMNPVHVNNVAAHTGNQVPCSRFDHEYDYLEQQLGRLSSVRGPPSQAGSTINTPRASRLADSATGGTSVSWRVHQRTASAVTIPSDAGQTISTSMAGSAACPNNNRSDTAQILTESQAYPAMVKSDSMSSDKHSVRFLQTDSHAPVQRQRLQSISSPGSNSRIIAHSAVQQLQRRQQQTAAQIRQRSGNGAGNSFTIVGQRHVERQQHQCQAVRAGNFETPDSTIPSLEHSAQPSSTQLPNIMSAAAWDAAGSTIARTSGASQVTANSEQMCSTTVHQTQAAPSQTQNSVSNTSTSKSSYIAAATAQPDSSCVASLVNSPASHNRVFNEACGSGFQSSKHRRVDLNSMMSPVTSMPASARSSVLTQDPEQVIQHHDSQPPQQQDALHRSSCKTPQHLQAQVQQLSRCISSKFIVTPTGGTTPRPSSEWKQQQLMMQKQLLAQQQQLLHLRSVSNSVASTPRQSAVVASAAAERHSIVTALSLSIPQTDTTMIAPSALSRSMATTAPASLHFLQSVQDRAATVPPKQQLMSTGGARPISTENCAQGPLPAASPLQQLQQRQVTGFSSDISEAAAAALTHRDTKFIAGPVEHAALVQLLVKRRKRMMLQKVLGGWRRYTVVQRLMGARESDNSSSSANADATQTGNSRADQQLPAQHTLSIGLTDIKAGLQQCLSADTANSNDDLGFVISGEVRLQRSPIKEHPPRAAVHRTATYTHRSGSRKGQPVVDRPHGTDVLVDDSANVIAAQKKSLQNALMEVKGAVEKMESLCVSSSNNKQQQQLERNSCNQAAAAGRDSVQGSEQQASGKAPASNRSPDLYRLRGQLRHVQDKLSRIEVKMCQAQAMSDDWCCSGASSCGSPPHRRPAGCLVANRSENCVQQQQLVCGCGAGCRGGCVKRAGVKRRILVGRMQDEIGQLQHELTELRHMLPGAYA